MTYLGPHSVDVELPGGRRRRVFFDGEGKVSAVWLLPHGGKQTERNIRRGTRAWDAAVEAARSTAHSVQEVGTWVNVGSGLAEFVPAGDECSASIHAQNMTDPTDLYDCGECPRLLGCVGRCMKAGRKDE